MTPRGPVEHRRRRRLRRIHPNPEELSADPRDLLQRRRRRERNLRLLVPRHQPREQRDSLGGDGRGGVSGHGGLAAAVVSLQRLEL